MPDADRDRAEGSEKILWAVYVAGFDLCVVLLADPIRIPREPGDREASEDIVQLAFTRTISAIQRGYRISDLSLWVHNVICNLATDYHRVSRSRPTESLLDNTHVDRRPDPPTFVELRNHCEMITETLRNLTKEQRQIFLLSVIRGLSYREAASALDTTKGSIRQSLFRTRQAIRIAVDSYRETAEAIAPS